MSLGLYNARSCRVRDQHRIRARNQDSEIAAEEIRDRGMGFSDSDRHANSQPYCNNIGNGYCYCYCRAEVYADAQAAAYATSAPISSSV
jgi:hypothetical protein